MESNRAIELYCGDDNDDNDEKADISIRGYINAERKAAPDISLPIKELLHNCLEIIRIARQKDTSIKGKINIILRLENNKLYELKVVDIATSSTGISNLKSKKIYKLYSHNGDSTGFSECGIGAALETMRCSDLIEHHTITPSRIYERTIWDVQKSRTINSLKDAIDYEENPLNKPLVEHLQDGFTTGTAVICKNILTRLKNNNVSDYIIKENTSCLYDDLCKHLVQYDNQNVNISLLVYKNSELKFNEPIIQKKILENKIKKFKMICCEDKITGDRASFILYSPDMDNYDKFDSNDNLETNNFEISSNAEFINHYTGQGIDLLTKSKQSKFTFDSIKEKYNIISKIILLCSTGVKVSEDNKIKDAHRMGFYGFREVAGGNIVGTTNEPLTLKWGTFKSHKTRYTQFRGVIHYDRKSDHLLMSDKSKTLSNERDVDPSVRFNILKLTHDYFAKMKSEHGDYNTEKPELPPPSPPSQSPVPSVHIELEPQPPPSHPSQYQVPSLHLEPEPSPPPTPMPSVHIELEPPTPMPSVHLEPEPQLPPSPPSQYPVPSVHLEPEPPTPMPCVHLEPEPQLPPSPPSQYPVPSVHLEPESPPPMPPVHQEPEQDPIKPTIIIVQEHDRSRVTREQAINAIKLIEKNTNSDIEYEILEHLVDVACNLLGKGSDKLTESFIKCIPKDKLILNIISVWSARSSDSEVKMGSNVVNFVKSKFNM